MDDQERNLANYIQMYEAKLDIIERLAPIASEKLTGEERTVTLSEIDEQIGAVVFGKMPIA